MGGDRRIIRTIRKALPAVVSILSRTAAPDLAAHYSYSFRPGGAQARKNKRREPEESGSGSGFIADPSGLVLTNKHVLESDTAGYDVILADGRRLPARVLSRDPVNDVAILKIESEGKFPTLRLGDARNAELGQSVLAIGNALGVFDNTVSRGIISGLSRSIAAKDGDGPAHELRGLIQTDAAINPGNSGGPLVNLRGEAVGINVAVIANAQSIGFAIPINAAERDLTDIRKYGHLRRPFLGLRYLALDGRLKKTFGLSVDRGVLLLPEGPESPAVMAGSPAAKAGLRDKDILLGLNGKPLDAQNTIQSALDLSAVGDKWELQVLRNGKALRINVVLAERF